MSGSEQDDYVSRRDQLSKCGAESDEITKHKIVTTFAASGDILKGRRPFKAAFWLLFAEAKSTYRPRFAGSVVPDVGKKFAAFDER